VDEFKSMNTGELISALVGDYALQPRPRPIGRSLVAAIIAGFATSVVLFSVTLGIRPDFISALGTWRYDMKLVGSLVLAILAASIASRVSKPTVSPRSVMLVLVVPVIFLLVAVTYELTTIPASAWLPLAMGMNGPACAAHIVILSIVPLGAVVYALRQGAPMSPSATGATAGLLAGAMGATVFAMHCMEDSPLFVAIWYTLATGLMAMAGRLIGRYALRW
jgi:hypothetical protein